MSAFGGKADMTGCRCPLSRSLLGVKRTSSVALHMSAPDPKRIFNIQAALSVGRRHALDSRHHAPVLVLQDVAVVDEFAELREWDVEHDRWRLATAAAPLRDRADAVLVVVDLIRDLLVRLRHAEREIVLHNAAVGTGHAEA